jgi:hypothetical protein
MRHGALELETRPVCDVQSGRATYRWKMQRTLASLIFATKGDLGRAGILIGRCTIGIIAASTICSLALHMPRPAAVGRGLSKGELFRYAASIANDGVFDSAASGQRLRRTH